MSGTIVIAGSGASLHANDIYSYLGIDKKKLGDIERKLVVEILGVLAYHKIDSETGLGILKSFELRSKPKDDLDKRLESFQEFLNSVDHRTDLIDSVKNLGMLSKDELEEQARETGDWIPVVRRNAYDVKRKEERDHRVSEENHISNTGE